MKLVVFQNTLFNAIHKINSVTSSNAKILLESVNNNILKLTSDNINLKIKIIITIAIKNIEQHGKIIVPLKDFYNIFKNLCGNLIYLNIDKNKNISIKDNQSCFTVYKEINDQEEDLNFINEHYFKDNAYLREFVITSKELSEILNLVNYAANNDTNRQILNSILFNINENNLICVTTDGRRLAIVERCLNDVTGNNGSVIIPIRSINELIKLLSKTKKVIIKINDNTVSFYIDNDIVFISTIIKENYLDYSQIIPKQFSKKATLNINKKLKFNNDKEESLTLVDAIRKTVMLTSNKNCYVKMIFNNNTLTLQSQSEKYFGEQVIKNIEYQDESITILLNPKFILDAISKIDTTSIVFKMNDKNSPIVISDECGFIYIMMPIFNRVE